MEILKIDKLLALLDSETIKKIDEDPLLKKEKLGPLTIANASKRLFTPTEQHHLYAKGIVYDDDYNVVSLPLLKIYNLGEKPRGDKLAKNLKLTEVPHKWDGTMIQIFKYKAEVFYTTRSKFETDPFCVWAREIMEDLYPSFEPVAGFTYVFELIHPDNRIVTDYGIMRDMVLLSVWDGKKYMTLNNIRKEYNRHLHVVENLFHGPLEEVEKKVRQLDDGREGVVLVFEDDDQVLHRTKVKADYYIELFRMKNFCTYKNVKPVLLSNPDLHDWDSFWKYNMDSNVFAEELKDVLREYFDRFMLWKSDVDVVYQQAKEETNQFIESYKPSSAEEFKLDEWDVNIEEMCRTYSKRPDRNNLVFLGIRGRLTWEVASTRVEDNAENES